MRNEIKEGEMREKTRSSSQLLPTEITIQVLCLFKAGKINIFPIHEF